jgi:hypothetical protein
VLRISQGDVGMIDPPIFGPFVRMVQSLPAKAIVRGMDLEYEMLQNDFEFDRYPLTEEAKSILCFRKFVHVAKFGGIMYFTNSFPPEHYEFYRQTLVRLINANELPASTLETFDRLFPPDSFSLAA